MSRGNSFDVAVVGAGISGLLSALALSKEGRRVLVVEKEGHIGGVCRSYDVDGYTVDTGPHIITRMDSGPLKELMDRYFDVVPNFVPHGRYYVRINERTKPFPWSVKEWMLFDLLPIEDRSLMMKTVFDIIYMLSTGKDLSKVSVEDIVPKNLSQSTESFLEYLSYFMLGTSADNAPVARFLDRKGYKREKNSENNGLSIPYVGRLYNMLIGGRPSDQMYPRGGIQKIVDSIALSLPRSVQLNLSESLVSIDVECEGEEEKVRGITTDKGEYTCDSVVYSGSATDIPELVGHDLPQEYVENLKSIERVNSLTIWLGLDRKTFTRKGSEMWVSTDPSRLHSWIIPTSNYDSHLAPKGRQLVGFAFIVPAGTSTGAVRKRAYETIFTSMPELEKRVEMTHYQELVPENACWSINSGFGDVETPVGNLYCVGSSSVKRSMGLTRCSYSVLRMMELMGINGRAG